jgi:hypothetical protein
MSGIDVRNHQKPVYGLPLEARGERRRTLQALCLGAALEIVNLLEADGADHTYTAHELADIIYKNIDASSAI